MAVEGSGRCVSLNRLCEGAGGNRTIDIELGLLGHPLAVDESVRDEEAAVLELREGYQHMCREWWGIMVSETHVLDRLGVVVGACGAHDDVKLICCSGVQGVPK